MQISGHKNSYSRLSETTHIYSVFSPALTIVVVISSQVVPIHRDHKMLYQSPLTDVDVASSVLIYGSIYGGTNNVNIQIYQNPKLSV